MATYNNPALQKFGFINTSPSPTVRAYQPDVTAEITEATFREGLSRDEAPGGNGYFGGFQSEFGFAGVDQDPKSQAETWATAQTAVRMVAVTPDLIIQWQRDDRLLTGQTADFTQTNLEKGEYRMRREGGGEADHDVYIGRNGLLYLAPENGGWADTDGDNEAEGYTFTNTNSEDFSGGEQAFFVDTGTTGGISETVPFPLDDVTVTLSAEHTQIHDDDNAIRIEALDASKNLISSAFTDKGVSNTGRKFAVLTTPSGTHYLKVYPCRVVDPSANNTKAKVKDPALRLGDASVNPVLKNYVTR